MGMGGLAFGILRMDSGLAYSIQPNLGLDTTLISHRKALACRYRDDAVDGMSCHA